MKKGKRKSKATKKKGELNLRHWLTQKLRRISYQYPPRKEAIKRSRVSRGKYRCAICLGENFGPKEIQLDHIEPVVDPNKGFTNWDDFILRLFVGVDSWQTVCRPCHSYKTSFENEIRKQVKSMQDPDDEI